ncbi:sugar isomerase [Salinactinospora qingdaonensis]|uniref:SIS domain-containing protein n=1 Tax=Salinactinospora qingdaonensis TaxID=702744 RepID=A0ABP7FSV5_9ACTN
MTAKQLAADLAAKPTALTELADHLVRHDPYAALPALFDDEPAAIVLLGAGPARYACAAAAARMRQAGLGATAEYTSTTHTPPPAPDTLVVAVDCGVGGLELSTRLDRYVEQCAIVLLTADPTSPLTHYADVVVALRAGAEDSELGCRACQHALALLLLLAHRLGAPPVGGSADPAVTLRRVANACADLLERAATWLPQTASTLLGPDSEHGVHFIAPAERLASAHQAVSALRRGPIVHAYAAETGDWSYSDRYLAAIEDYRAVLFAGSAYDERFSEQLLQLRGTFVSVGGEVAGAQMSLRYLGDTDPDIRLLTEPLVGELLAAHWWAGRPG